MKRRRLTPTTSPDDPFALQAKADREKAQSLPLGKERDNLLRRARQAETASHLGEWLASPGLQSPK
jgi:hypothetical protein